MRKYQILSLGTAYLDINFTSFPFTDALFAQRETVGPEYSMKPGGSALNFAIMCASLGLKTLFIGKIGNDEIGKFLIKSLRGHAVLPLLITSKNVQTNLAVHYIKDDGTSIMTSGGSANQNLNAEEALKEFIKIANSVEYLYLGGGFKLHKLLTSYKEFTQEAKKRGVKVILDHGRVTNIVTQKQISLVRDIIPYIDIYLPSKDEFLSVWQAKTIQQGIHKIREISNCLVVVKNASKGTFFCDRNETHVFSAGILPVKVKNTVGAGDAFNAGLIKALTMGLPLEESVVFATAAAALKVTSSQSLTVKNVKAILNNPSS